MEKFEIQFYATFSQPIKCMNFCVAINSELISYITDTTPTKQNKYSPGMHIPIYDYEYFNANIPDYCFLGAWNHSKEMFLKESNNFSKKGNWITHTPNFKIFSK